MLPARPSLTNMQRPTIGNVWLGQIVECCLSSALAKLLRGSIKVKLF
jgi:hypothetical protein